MNKFIDWLLNGRPIILFGAIGSVVILIISACVFGAYMTRNRLPSGIVVSKICNPAHPTVGITSDCKTFSYVKPEEFYLRVKGEWRGLINDELHEAGMYA